MKDTTGNTGEIWHALLSWFLFCHDTDRSQRSSVVDIGIPAPGQSLYSLTGLSSQLCNDICELMIIYDSMKQCSAEAVLVFRN